MEVRGEGIFVEVNLSRSVGFGYDVAFPDADVLSIDQIELLSALKC